MQDQTIHRHRFGNGLTLLVEPMDDVQSAAFSFLVPAGCIYEQPGASGTTAILADLITRGAGELNSKELATRLDYLGVQGSESPGHGHLSLTGATLADNIPDVLKLYADVILRPHLPADEFQAAKAGVEQSLWAAEDDPRQKLMPVLRKRTYDAPWGRSAEGELPDLPNITVETVREHYHRCFRPDEAIIGIAGRVDFESVKNTIGELLADWPSKPSPTYDSAPGGPHREHIEFQSEQTHIAMAYRSVAVPHPDYYTAWAAACVLGHGMSSRLFTEVREKRGLCYSVSASLGGVKHEGRVFCYAGSLADRAQETLDVMLEEINRLQKGVTENELLRCKAMAKSALVMQQESTRARAWSIASGWYYLDRTRTLQEVSDEIDAISVASIQEFLDRYPAGGFTIVTLGPQPLEVPEHAIS